ncbi:hypothetical protein [Pelotomaculum isophthalicicum]|nr:hypothetical protein [Pelotomaculum isophthalicicum]
MKDPGERLGRTLVLGSLAGLADIRSQAFEARSGSLPDTDSR